MAKTASNTLTDPQCADYDDVEWTFFYWNLFLLFSIPAFNYILYVLSRGASHKEILTPIIFGFMQLKGTFSLKKRKETRRS